MNVQCEVVRSVDTESFRGGIFQMDFLGSLDVVEVGNSETGRSLGREDTTPGIDKIVRRDHRAVAPMCGRIIRCGCFREVSKPASARIGMAAKIEPEMGEI